MNTTAILRSAGSAADAPGAPLGPQVAGGQRRPRGSATGIGLWVFIGVATMLFSPSIRTMSRLRTVMRLLP